MIINPMIEAGALSWLAAQAVKSVMFFVRNKKLTARAALGAGGMPSSHTSMMVAVTYCAGWCYGLQSGIFALSLMTTLIVMYDATGVRWEAGRHAAAINDMRGEKAPHLKESLGHRHIEVLCGAVLGLIIAIAVCFIHFY